MFILFSLLLMSISSRGMTVCEHYLDRVIVISISDCSVKGRSFRYTLVSRRSCYRAGTRYNIRGIDTDGQVANFVETEQIIECGNSRCSYVQVSDVTFACLSH